MKVSTVGGGIGGLALAATLGRFGVECQLFEQHPGLRETGFALTVQRNALQALGIIGLEQAVRGAGQALTDGLILTPAGRVLARMSLEACALQRRTLQGLLADAAPRDVIQFGRRIESAVSDGWTVAADGIHSCFRDLVAPGNPPPRDAGYIAWRGLAPAGSVPVATARRQQATETWGRGVRFGVVPIENDQVYWFAVARDAPADEAPQEMRRFLLKTFGHWHHPIGNVLDATPCESILLTRVVDRLPLPMWHSGQLVLLGDAAHAMTPNLGQGGCQAIEDAVVLGRCFAQLQQGRLQDDELGPRYQQLRKPRADRIAAQSFALGRVANVGNPALVALRNLAMRATPRRLREKSLGDILTFPAPSAD
ncbi:MAG: FAD-dependent monooxygenase [Planctomycetales bacterium]|nr:FAD-dependent monooxygenase [Planctomycetales bacterium]